MIKIINKINVDGDQAYHYEFSGLSSDTKPTEYGGVPIEVNSLFLELDTNKIYYLSEDGWAEVGKSGGSALVPEQTFTGALGEGDVYYAYLVTDRVISNDTIKVIYDGEEYICSNISEYDAEYEYGAPFEGEGFDFSTYPFNLYSHDSEGYAESLQVTVGDGNEHTIAIYEA